MTERLFGRKPPSDWLHTELYPLAAAAPIPIPDHIVKTLAVPKDFKKAYYQNGYNGCVGASLSQMMAFYNSKEGGPCVRYDWQWLWNQAKAIDEFPDTKPGDNEGTSVRAGFDVLRKMGLARLKANGKQAKHPKPNPDDGILSNYWVTTVDQMRGVIALGFPVEMGTLFTRAMENPKKIDGHFRMPESTDFRDVAGGHAWGIYGADDDRQCFLAPGTWDVTWPDPSGEQVFCEAPYGLMAQLLGNQGEAGVAVDRVTAIALGLKPMEG